MSAITFTKTNPPAWLLAMRNEIDGKTFGCFAEDAICNLGVADWHRSAAIRQNLRDFIDKGHTAHHDVVEYSDSPLLKVFQGKLRMTFDDPAIPPAHPTMTHLSYMDERDPTKLGRWIRPVAPTSF